MVGEIGLSVIPSEARNPSESALKKERFLGPVKPTLGMTGEALCNP